MSDIPNKVIEQAARAAMYPPLYGLIEADASQDGCEHLGISDAEAVVRAAAPVIARWAREQGREEGVTEEQARVRGILHATKLDGDDFPEERDSGWQDALNAALADLDRLDNRPTVSRLRAEGAARERQRIIWYLEDHLPMLVSAMKLVVRDLATVDREGDQS